MKMNSINKAGYPEIIGAGKKKLKIPERDLGI
jgi:hypothetical protein